MSLIKTIKHSQREEKEMKPVFLNIANLSLDLRFETSQKKLFYCVKISQKYEMI